MKTVLKRQPPRHILLSLFFFLPFMARANPVIINPSSLFAFCAVAFWSLEVEAGIVALLLAFHGVAPLRAFIAYSFTNAAVFLFFFQPLLEGSVSPPVPVLEFLVILLDALFIKLLVTIPAFQGADYRGVSWVRSALISGVGNALSYFLGFVAAQRPWEMP